ncbi:hypothetical protein P171DRAFT_431461 [Karstenula rhodostoma CBS 690.94]|uniref:Uncharacterized protein n=1 Tax=Karstenula rhodostoma CBS 690.94 TaxID=1392251 RepID=A0A9P4PIG8_9PLEO|nr:hypothetical protein P171DRAFT_431461 [Karstenula rhodostoma CBS 690.94]
MSPPTHFLRVTARTASRAPLRRGYATGHEQRTQQTLKTSSRLTWLTTTSAALAAAAYYYTTTSSSSSSPSTPSTSSITSKIDHAKHADLEAPKPVEDRHGDTVAKHAMAAHKNQTKVREGVFSGEEFDNHLSAHSRDPSKDFEKKK